MKPFLESLLGLWRQLGINQRVSLAVAALAVIGGLVGLVLWSRQPDYQLLYGRLSEKDSAQIISAIQSQNIPYKLANGGSTVYVPTENLYRLRMDLAGRGLPSGDGVGFEIFDKGQFGLSDFVQRTNYIRALQGELARTIGQLDGVGGARVMIVQPENRLLVTNQGVKPTASVFIELNKSRLEPEAVDSIRHLVANAVQGLEPDDVAVVDQRGHVLSEELRQDPSLGTASSQMRYRQQVEDYFGQKVQSMLAAVVGEGNAVVRVSAEIDTEATTLTAERFDPDGQVVRSQTQTEDASNSTEQRNSGAVGVAANTPDNTQGNAAAQNRPTNVTDTNRKVKTTAYEINRTVTNTTRQPGTIKSLTASVFIAPRTVVAAAGAGGAAPTAAPTVSPRTPAELQALQQIVINALGVKLAAGQKPESVVTLQELPFEAAPPAEQIATIQSETSLQSWIDVARRYVAGVVGLIALFIFWRMLRRQRPEPVPVELLNAPALEGGRGYQNKAPLTPEVLNELIQQKPANVGTALRDWVAVKKN